ncbi:MAG: sigma-70 family RNA polymerase sigma factor [Elainellaceae cyanobacterium]
MHRTPPLEDRALIEHLNHLVQQTCRHPQGSLERQQGLNIIIRTLQQSGKIWRAAQQLASGDILPDEYGDALQLTWLYVCRNLCEATTGKAFDPSIANLFTWMNSYLKYRLKDAYRARKQQDQSRLKPAFTDGQWFDPLSHVPAQPTQPDILQSVQGWVNARAMDLKAVHLRDRPQVNAYVLIQRRLPPETTWSALSEEFGVSVATLSSFYQRECLPRLRQFGESEGYL